jgi:hypothetical protein
MSHGTNIELTHRDLGIEIEKLLEDRDHWRNVANGFADEIEYLQMELSEAKSEYTKLSNKYTRAIRGE